MTKAEELRAKAARLNKQKTPAASAGAPAAPAPPAPKAVRAAAIRVTVDLPPAQHRALQTWTAETAETLGWARVTKQDVFAALLARLLADPDLSAQIVQDLADTK